MTAPPARTSAATGTDAAAGTGPAAPGAPCRPLVVLVNLGTPRAPTPSAVRRYLREFLSDRRVVGLHPALWRPVLELMVLPVRSRASARKYASVWRADGSPLLVHTEAAARGVRERLGTAAEVRVAMTYGDPGLSALLGRVAAEPRPAGAPPRAVLVVPLYPQYSSTSTASVHDVVHRWALAAPDHLDLRLLRSYPTDPGYVTALVTALHAHWDRVGRPDAAAGDRVLLSYHGIPVSVAEGGDPYPQECAATTAALAARLDLPDGVLLATYQSRFGPAPWLTPATIDTVRELAAAGTRRVDVLCPGFAADCLETLEEIALLNRAAFTTAGGQVLHHVPWGNGSEPWADALAAIVRRALPR
ncbi:MAG TPA: ferrochelatase [Cellulomonas sp.]